MSESVITAIAQKAKRASRSLVSLSITEKTAALKNAAARLRENAPLLREENRKDIEEARKNRLSQAMIDRLTLSDRVIEGMAAALEEIAELPDPVGRITGMTRRPNGLLV
ncbi:MAG TPA: gamma-glutamyl-phosphate reductase, partial [Deltaproteobacteria bacterium]|nr:gamma-glutamyl-phosphate reductase [Deltaproteobacteria bacterium]